MITMLIGTLLFYLCNIGITLYLRNTGANCGWSDYYIHIVAKK
jgi:hypothetical protein